MGKCAVAHASAEADAYTEMAELLANWGISSW